MVLEKKLEEDAHVKYQFRSKPIPPEVLIPRYNNMLEADQARKQLVRSQSMAITKSREAPFTFWEREKLNIQKKKQAIEDYEIGQLKAHTFRANPIPRACSVLIYAKKIKQDEE